MKIDMSFWKDLGISDKNAGAYCGEWLYSQDAPLLDVVAPITGETIASVYQATPEEYEKVVAQSQKAFKYWINIPALKSGEIVRLIGNGLRKYKYLLGKLSSTGNG